MVHKVTALDIGHFYIKLVELTRKRGSVCVSACDMVSTPKDAIQGGHVQKSLELADAIRNLFDRTLADKSRVCVVTSGVGIDIRSMELPKMPVNEMHSAVLWELKETTAAYRNIPHDDIIADYHIVNESVNDAVSGVVVVSTTKPFLYGYVDMLHSLKIRPVIFDVGVLNMLWACDGTIASRCYVIVGARSVQIYITEKGQFGLCRILPFGGDCVADALSECLNISLDQAEALKRESDLDSVMMDGDKENQVYLEALNRIVSAILQTLEYRRQQRRLSSIEQLVDSIVVTGGETKIKGLTRLFEEQIDLPVVKCDPFQFLDFDKRVDQERCTELAEFVAPAVAMGLRGMDEL